MEPRLVVPSTCEGVTYITDRSDCRRFHGTSSPSGSGRPISSIIATTDGSDIRICAGYGAHVYAVYLPKRLYSKLKKSRFWLLITHFSKVYT
jgi:hypothetical protein